MFRLRIYELKDEYVDYLARHHQHLFYNKESGFKRKYIGVVLDVNGYKYFAPLSCDKF